MNNIKSEVWYLLKVDFDSFILTGYQLALTMDTIAENRVVELHDIAGNYLLKPLTDQTKISYQELYKIKRVELM